MRSEADKLVLDAATHGLQLLPIVEFTPAWASTHPHSIVSGDHPPADLNLYASS